MTNTNFFVIIVAISNKEIGIFIMNTAQNVIAKTCFSMYELREKLAIQFGREPMQLTFFMPPPAQLTQPK